MMLPDRRPTATTAGQPATESADAQAQAIITAVNEALSAQPTAYADPSPLPAVGAAPPVAQPGRPPMSQRATDVSALMLSGGAASVLVGGGASLVMLASGSADPVVCAIVFGAPAVLVLALGRLAGWAKVVAETAPPVIHQHYTGTVVQDSRSISTQTRGVIANTRNETR